MRMHKQTSKKHWQWKFYSEGNSWNTSERMARKATSWQKAKPEAASPKVVVRSRSRSRHHRGSDRGKTRSRRPATPAPARRPATPAPARREEKHRRGDDEEKNRRKPQTADDGRKRRDRSVVVESTRLPAKPPKSSNAGSTAAASKPVAVKPVVEESSSSEYTYVTTEGADSPKPQVQGVAAKSKAAPKAKAAAPAAAAPAVPKAQGPGVLQALAGFYADQSKFLRSFQEQHNSSS